MPQGCADYAAGDFSDRRRGSGSRTRRVGNPCRQHRQRPHRDHAFRGPVRGPTPGAGADSAVSSTTPDGAGWRSTRQRVLAAPTPSWVWLKLREGAVNRVLGNTDDNGTYSTYALLLTIYGVPYFYSGSQVDANAMHGVAVNDGGWHMVNTAARTAHQRRSACGSTTSSPGHDPRCPSPSPQLATWSVGANERARSAVRRSVRRVAR